MRILIVEDDSLFAEILQVFLKTKGCNSIVASTLEQARVQIQSANFDFILLDNHLPDGDGIQFIHVTKALHYQVPVMMITAENDQVVMADAFDKGADDFLLKPISMDLLWKKIQRCRGLYDKEADLAKQSSRLAKLLDQRTQEEKLARYVYEHVAATSSSETECIDTYIESSSVFNGDMFICDTAPNGNRFVILADATGHGLAAAISILPLVGIIRAMIRKGLSLAHIAHEANRKLATELPDDKFVTVIGVEVSFHKQQLQLFNAGMPDIVAIGKDHTVERYSSTTMALGILEPEDFEPGILTLDTNPIKNLFFYSDGLIEQPNRLGEAFGMDRLLEHLQKCDHEESLVKRVVNYFTAFNEKQELQDDLSMCDLQVEKLMHKHLCNTKKEVVIKHGRISADIQISGGLVSKADIVGCLDSIMANVDMVGDFRQRAFTVFAELISNGLDHGILDLDSDLKNDFSGFAEYLQLKEERLENISADANLGMKFVFTPAIDEIEFEIKDSGKGYKISEVADISDDKLSGRGVALIEKLCKSVEVFEPGNKTKVTLKRDN